MFQFIFRKKLKCIEELSIDAIEEHSFDEPVDRQTTRKFGVGRTLTVELPFSQVDTGPLHNCSEKGCGYFDEIACESANFECVIL